MEEKSYKDRLLKRVEEYLGDNYIDYKVSDRDKGIIYMYQIGKAHVMPDVIYNPFEATLKINSLNLSFESIIKERAVQIFKQYFKE